MVTDIAIDLLIGLTGILIAWQIYQSINIEHRVKRGVEKGLQESIPTAISVALAQQGMTLHNQGRKADAAQLLLNSFAVLDTHHVYKEFRLESENFAIATLTKYNKEKLVIVVPTMEEKEAYIKAACFSKNKDIIELVNRMEVENETE